MLSSIFGTGDDFNSELFQNSLSSIESSEELKKIIECLKQQLHSTQTERNDARREVANLNSCLETVVAERGRFSAMWTHEVQTRCQLQGYVQGIQGVQAMMMRMSNQPMMAAPLALQSSPHINILSQEFDTLRRDIDSLNTKRSIENSNLKAAKTELEATQTKLSIENSNLKATQTRLEEARSILQTIKTYIEKKNVVLETIQLKVRNENLKLETIQERVEKETIDLRESVSELEHVKMELEHAKTEQARVVGKYTSLRRKISSLKGDTSPTVQSDTPTSHAGRGRGVRVKRTDNELVFDIDF